MTEPWTAEAVKFELVRAYRVLFSVPVKDSFYTGGGGYWPMHLYERDEVEEQAKAATTRNERMRVPRNQFSPRDIKRMEAILLGDGKRKGWLVEFLDPKSPQKRMLAKWAIWRAAEREVKKECFIRGYAYSTFRKRRDQGAQSLADALNAAGVEAI